MEGLLFVLIFSIEYWYESVKSIRTMFDFLDDVHYQVVIYKKGGHCVKISTIFDSFQDVISFICDKTIQETTKSVFEEILDQCYEDYLSHVLFFTDGYSGSIFSPKAPYVEVSEEFQKRKIEFYAISTYHICSNSTNVNNLIDLSTTTNGVFLSISDWYCKIVEILMFVILGKVGFDVRQNANFNMVHCVKYGQQTYCSLMPAQIKPIVTKEKKTSYRELYDSKKDILGEIFTNVIFTKKIIAIAISVDFFLFCWRYISTDTQNKFFKEAKDAMSKLQKCPDSKKHVSNFTNRSYEVLKKDEMEYCYHNDDKKMNWQYMSIDKNMMRECMRNFTMSSVQYLEKFFKLFYLVDSGTSYHICIRDEHTTDSIFRSMFERVGGIPLEGKRVTCLTMLVCYTIPDHPMKERAEKFLMSEKGEWIDFENPAFYTPYIVQYLLRYSQFLTENEEDRFLRMSRIHLIKSNFSSQCEIRTITSLCKQLLPDKKSKCKVCNQFRSNTMMCIVNDEGGSVQKCGLCITKDTKIEQMESESYMCTCRNCGVRYAISCPEDMAEKCTPKCYGCKTTTIVPHRNCSKCGCAYADPSSMLDETFECEICRAGMNLLKNHTVTFSKLFSQNQQKMCELFGIENQRIEKVRLFELRNVKSVTQVIPQDLFFNGSKILNINELLEFIKSFEPTFECENCMEELAGHLRMKCCENPICDKMICCKCMEAFYTRNQMGNRYNFNGFTCPYCTQIPSNKFANVIGGISRIFYGFPVDLHEEHNETKPHAWCRKCNKIVELDEGRGSKQGKNHTVYPQDFKFAFVCQVCSQI